jgi:hypothetical protein
MYQAVTRSRSAGTRRSAALPSTRPKLAWVSAGHGIVTTILRRVGGCPISVPAVLLVAATRSIAASIEPIVPPPAVVPNQRLSSAVQSAAVVAPVSVLVPDGAYRSNIRYASNSQRSCTGIPSRYCATQAA